MISPKSQQTASIDLVLAYVCCEMYTVVDSMSDGRVGKMCVVVGRYLLQGNPLSNRTKLYFKVPFFQDPSHDHQLASADAVPGLGSSRFKSLEGVRFLMGATDSSLCDRPNNICECHVQSTTT